MAFESKPVLVFWETTKACPLRCIHCRADAMTFPAEGQLDTESGMALIDQVAAFGSPPPLLIFTGGDPLMREDLGALISYASSKGIKSAVAPAVSQNLSHETLDWLKKLGVSSISISLDSSSAEVHDSIRRVKGTYARTIEAIKYALRIGLGVQVNTAVMMQNVMELPAIFQLIKSMGVRVWEVFFLIATGRGSDAYDLSPEDYESACNILYDASQYGVIVRTVEAPFIRRVARQREEEGMYWTSERYMIMHSDLSLRCGAPTGKSSIMPRGTLDGDGIIFVAHDGTVSPGGFLPVALGNIKDSTLASIYRSDKRLLDIRNRKLSGPCGRCSYKDTCGGSRARAFSYGDMLGSDPACISAVEASRFIGEGP
jgi:radical SAM protein